MSAEVEAAREEAERRYPRHFEATPQNHVRWAFVEGARFALDVAGVDALKAEVERFAEDREQYRGQIDRLFRERDEARRQVDGAS